MSVVTEKSSSEFLFSDPSGKVRLALASLHSNNEILPRRLNFLPAKRADAHSSASDLLVPLNDISSTHPILPNKGRESPKNVSKEPKAQFDFSKNLHKNSNFEKSESEDDIVLNWIGARRIGSGLSNLGNTCFLNSVLQCLTHTPPLVYFLETSPHRQASCNVSGFCALCALQQHVQLSISASSTSRGVISPTTIVKNIRNISRTFRPGRQEDAHEYLRLLLDALHLCCLPRHIAKNSSLASKAPSFFQKTFGGILCSQVKCTVCNFCSLTNDPFLDLSLEIIKCDSLLKAFEKFTSEEILDGKNKYKCSKCSKLVRAVKSFKIEKSPPVLTIQLKRFDGIRGGKIDKKIVFNSVLDIKSFLRNPNKNGFIYDLYGVLVHSGYSTHSGHYFCFVKSSNGLWYVMDDSRVSEVSENTVLNQKAYILFYIQRSKTESKVSDPEIKKDEILFSEREKKKNSVSQKVEYVSSEMKIVQEITSSNLNRQGTETVLNSSKKEKKIIKVQSDADLSIKALGSDTKRDANTQVSDLNSVKQVNGVNVGYTMINHNHKVVVESMNGNGGLLNQTPKKDGSSNQNGKRKTSDFSTKDEKIVKKMDVKGGDAEVNGNMITKEQTIVGGKHGGLNPNVEIGLINSEKKGIKTDNAKNIMSKKEKNADEDKAGGEKILNNSRGGKTPSNPVIEKHGKTDGDNEQNMDHTIEERIRLKDVNSISTFNNCQTEAKSESEAKLIEELDKYYSSISKQPCIHGNQGLKRLFLTIPRMRRYYTFNHRPVLPSPSSASSKRIEKMNENATEEVEPDFQENEAQDPLNPEKNSFLRSLKFSKKEKEKEDGDKVKIVNQIIEKVGQEKKNRDKKVKERNENKQFENGNLDEGANEKKIKMKEKSIKKYHLDLVDHVRKSEKLVIFPDETFHHDENDADKDDENNLFVVGHGILKRQNVNSPFPDDNNTDEQTYIDHNSSSEYVEMEWSRGRGVEGDDHNDDGYAAAADYEGDDLKFQKGNAKKLNDFNSPINNIGMTVSNKRNKKRKVTEQMKQKDNHLKIGRENGNHVDELDKKKDLKRKKVQNEGVEKKSREIVSQNSKHEDSKNKGKQFQKEIHDKVAINNSHDKNNTIEQNTDAKKNFQKKDEKNQVRVLSGSSVSEFLKSKRKVEDQDTWNDIPNIQHLSKERKKLLDSPSMKMMKRYDDWDRELDKGRTKKVKSKKGGDFNTTMEKQTHLDENPFQSFVNSRISIQANSKQKKMKNAIKELRSSKR